MVKYNYCQERLIEKNGSKSDQHIDSKLLKIELNNT